MAEKTNQTSINKYLRSRQLDALAHEIAEALEKTGFFEISLVFRNGELFTIDRRTSVSINKAIRDIPAADRGRARE